MSNGWKQKHINDWSCEELQDWIASIKLGDKNEKKVIAYISDQGITGEDFNSIGDKEEIKDTFPGILALSANKIWAALKIIRNHKSDKKNTPTKKEELQDDGNNWHCSVCTFTNSGTVQQCEMCDNPQNKPETYSKNKYKPEPPPKKKSASETWKGKHIDNWSCQELQDWMGSIGLNVNDERSIQESIDTQGIEGEDFNSMESASDICDSFDGIGTNQGNKIYAALVNVGRMNKKLNTRQQKHNNYDDNNYDDNNYNDGCIRVYGGANDAKEQAANLRTMVNWLISEGAKFPKLYVKCYSNENHSVHTKSRLISDESICFIPHNCIITQEITMTSEIGQKIQVSKITLRSAHSWFAAYLLQEREKGINSKWCDYISILPKKHSTIPLFLENNERKELEGSLSLQKIDGKLQALSLEYDEICVAVPDFSCFSLNDFIWARCIVITRIYGLVIYDVKTSGLVPLADLFNPRKRERRETKWTYSGLRRGFLVTANFDIYENEELFEGYGRKCNSRFFVNYGYCLESNIDNEGLMTFALDKNDVLYQQKAIYLGFGNGEIVSKSFQIPMQYRNPKVKEAFSFLRILHSAPDEFEIISNNAMFNDVPKASIETERKVLESISAAAMDSLSNFSTSLEFDNNLLENEYGYPKGSIKRNIILMRRGEKEVLHFYINLEKTCVPLLGMSMATIDLRWKLRREQNGFEAEYINDVVIPLVQKKGKSNNNSNNKLHLLF